MSNSGINTDGKRLGTDGMLGLVMLSVLIIGVVVWASSLAGVERTDFSMTYVAARLVVQGNKHLLYDQATQERLRDSLFTHPSPLFFEHPPFEALLLSPLGALSFRTAYLIWGLINAGIWIVLVAWLRTYLPWPREDLGYCFLWLLFAPLLVALFQGQPSIILLGLFAWCFVELKHEREFMAGLALGLGLFKFQFVLPLALIFVLRRQWRLIYGFLCSSALLVGLSLLTVGARGLVDYGEFILRIARHPSNLSYGSAVDMPTITGLFYAILPASARSALPIAAGVFSLALLASIALLWQKTGTAAQDELLYAAAVAAALASGSHMFTHDFSPLLLGMFLVGSRLSSVALKNSALRWSLIFSMATFWCFPVYFLFIHWHCAYLLCPVLLLFIFSAVLAARRVIPVEQHPAACATA